MEPACDGTRELRASRRSRLAAGQFAADGLSARLARPVVETGVRRGRVSPGLNPSSSALSPSYCFSYRASPRRRPSLLDIRVGRSSGRSGQPAEPSPPTGSRSSIPCFLRWRRVGSADRETTAVGAGPGGHPYRADDSPALPSTGASEWRGPSWPRRSTTCRRRACCWTAYVALRRRTESVFSRAFAEFSDTQLPQRCTE